MIRLRKVNSGFTDLTIEMSDDGKINIYHDIQLNRDSIYLTSEEYEWIYETVINMKKAIEATREFME